MKFLVKGFLATVLISNMIACKNDTKTAQETTAVTTTETAPTTQPVTSPSTETTTTNTTEVVKPTDGAVKPNVPQIEETKTTAVPAKPGKSTTVQFEEMKYNWGTMKEGDKMTHIFKFKNTGKEPLVILDAKGSCGCTVPEKPNAPILPGKTGDLKVVFDSKGKEGDQTKTVTVTANTTPETIVLTIGGKVEKKAE